MHHTDLPPINQAGSGAKISTGGTGVAWHEHGIQQKLDPELRARVNIGSLSVLDMIDMDEGCLPVKD